MALTATIPNGYEQLAGAATANSLMIFMHDTLNTDANFTIVKQAGTTAGEDLFKATIVHADYDDAWICKRNGTQILVVYDPQGLIDIDTGTGVISGASSDSSGDSNGGSTLTDRNGTVVAFDASLTVNSLTMGTKFFASLTDTQAGFKIIDSTNNYFYWILDFGRVGARTTPLTSSEKHGVGFLAGQFLFSASSGEFLASSSTRSRIFIGNGYWRRPIGFSSSRSVNKFNDVGNYTSPLAVDMRMNDIDGTLDSDWGVFTQYHWIDELSRNAKQLKASSTTDQAAIWLNYNASALKYACLWNVNIRP